MRVLKQNDQSFLAGVFGYQGKLFFSAACILFFDLEHPETPLPEKELWQCIKGQIPRGTTFDTGMPKPVAEVLVHGAFHPAQGAVAQAGQVSFSCGDVAKALAVFGPRRWTSAGDEAVIVHEEPTPAPIPITWRNAFGGTGFARNPVGTGLDPVARGDEAPYHPLPQVEYPNQLLGRPDDRPEPSSFAPIPDPTWPQRAGFAGTYDDHWLKTHWPRLPDDFDMRLFNTASQDQWHRDFFKGDEGLRIEGMHPLRRAIQSRLPGLRIRCFVTQLKKPRSDHHDLTDAWFKEARTNLDTVWLFPGALRGALCFRSVLEIQDDEYRDVANVLLVTEKLDAPDHPLEYYRDLRDTWVSRLLKLDKDPAAKGKQQIADAINRFKKMPGEIQAKLERSLNPTPRAPTPPAAMIAKGHARLDASEALLGKLEAMAAGMRAKHGHLVHVDMGVFSRMRQTIAAQRQHLDKAGKSVRDAEKEIQEGREKAHAIALERKKALEARGLKADFDPDDVLLGPKELRWQKAFWQHVPQWQEHLRQNDALRAKLHDLGLRDATLDNAFLGLNPAPLRLERRLWGLPPGADDLEHFTIPAGLVLPRFIGSTPAALHLRENVPQLPPFPAAGPDTLVPGSKPPPKAPLLLAARESKPLVIVADSLEALLLAQECGDLCAVLAAPNPADDPGEDALKLAKAAPLVLVAPTAKDEPQAEEIVARWHKTFPQAQRWRLPHQGLIHAKRQGQDLRKDLRTLLCQTLPPALLEALPPEPEPDIGPGDVKPGMAIPTIDVKGLVSSAQAQAKARGDAIRLKITQEAEAAKTQAMRQMEETMRRHGLEPPLLPKPEKYVRDFGAIKNEIAQALATCRTKLTAQKLLTPEIEERLASVESTSTRLLDKAAAVLPAGGGITPPDWAKKLRAKHGLDPETGAGPDRERVKAMLAAGDSFNKLNLSKLDLSGLDFSGRDLTAAICQNTNFSGCTMRGAILHKAFCREADFSGADLDAAVLDSAVLHKAVLKSAKLTNTSCRAALFSQADCSGADFSGANLERALFQKAVLPKAVLARVRAQRTVFNQVEFKDNSFANADLTRTVFVKCRLPGQNFQGVTLENTAFIQTECQGADFSGASMTKVRFLKKSDCTKANFRGARLVGASFLGAMLAGADFSAARLDKAILQECDCKGAVFERTRAWHARFNLCDLSGANMRGLDLLGGSLRKARLTQTDLTAANCYGVDFFKATVGDTVLHRANLKKSLLERREDLLS